MSDLSDTLVQGVLGGVGIIASAYSLGKFILSTKIKIGTLSDDEKDMDMVLCFDSTAFSKEAIDFFVNTVKQRSQLQIVYKNSHHDSPNQVLYLVGASHDALVTIKERRDRLAHSHLLGEKDIDDFDSGNRLDLITYELNRIQVPEGIKKIESEVKVTDEDANVKKSESDLTETDTESTTEQSSIPKPFRENDLLFAHSIHTSLLTDCFPLHNDEERHALVEKWVKKWREPQPINQIRAYFGDEVGYYFAFLGMYTRWLVVPAILACLVFIIELFSEKNGMYGRAIYSLFITSWATGLLKFWKRRESKLASEWLQSGTDINQMEQERPDFSGERRFDPIEGRHFTYFSTTQRMYRYMATSVVTLVVLGVILKLMFLYFQSEKLLSSLLSKENGWEGIYQYMSFLPSALYAVAVMVFDMGFSTLAAYLTKFENHRTDEEYSSALVLKLASFYFVNNFGSLFYLAFVRRDMELLQQTLSSLLITRQLIGNFQEQIIPFMKRTSTLKTEAGRLAQKNHDKSPIMNKIDAELVYPTYDGTFDDYLELFVQFGQVTLFAAAYPLASLWSLANNIVEIRSDGFKLCASFRRNRRVKCEGIGTWLFAFTTLGYISVVTNCAIFGLHSGLLDTLYPSLTRFDTLIYVALMEHAMIGIKVVIEVMVPDTPSAVLEKKRMIRAALRKRAQMQVEQAMEAKKEVDDTDASSVTSETSEDPQDTEIPESMSGKELQDFMQSELSKRMKLKTEVKSVKSLYTNWLREEQTKRKNVEQQLSIAAREFAQRIGQSKPHDA